MWLAVGFLIVVAALIHYRPTVGPDGPEPLGVEDFTGGVEDFTGGVEDFTGGVEGFTTTAIHPTRMPECIARSTDAQALLGRLANVGGDAADELRLLLTKMCCMEADIATPSAGRYRTLHNQYRTSHDMEPPSSIVGRCLRNAVNQRDIELIVEKFAARGHLLIDQICTGADRATSIKEFDGVVARLQLAMTSFCLREPPSMDHPAGPRDVGFWDSDESDLPQYQGVSAEPR